MIYKPVNCLVMELLIVMTHFYIAANTCKSLKPLQSITLSHKTQTRKFL